MRLDLSLCGMWYCKALVLLGQGFFFLQCRVLALPRVYCVICTIYAAACSVIKLCLTTYLFLVSHTHNGDDTLPRFLR